MRILYDGYIFFLQKAGGINRYFRELITRLPSSARPTIYGSRKPALHLPSHPNLRWKTPPHFAGLLRTPLGWWSSSFDVFHPSYYHLTRPFDWRSLRKPVVLTVHDFIFSKYAHRYERSGKLLRDQEAAIRRADFILCVSHSTRADLLERFPDCEGRSVVTHLASNLPALGDSPCPHNRPYFLFVGARAFYKNFDLAIRAVELLNKCGREVDLLVAGPPWKDEEKKSLAERGADRFVKLFEFPPDETLASLYTHCVALIYPSEYEGFGLPPLEAMTQGAPVLALRTSSLPEVVGDGGILIDPQSATGEAFASAAAELLESALRREALSRAAIKQSRKFSWDRAALETYSAYRHVAGEKPRVL